MIQASETKMVKKEWRKGKRGDTTQRTGGGHAVGTKKVKGHQKGRTNIGVH